MKNITDKQKTILLVEDEIVIALGQIMQLEKHGYQIIHAINGEKAIKTAVESKGEIDLILMDIDLGKGIDGTQAAKRILETEEIPVVFLSSHTEPEVVEKTETITSYGYVVKDSGITVLDASNIKVYTFWVVTSRPGTSILLAHITAEFLAPSRLPNLTVLTSVTSASLRRLS